jgi:AraC-like DNA-binding protein/mannose-6-phosphate isomerase-like protein (cupin superfamily)
MGDIAASRAWEGEDLDQAGSACPGDSAPGQCAGGGPCSVAPLGCRHAHVGIARRRPRRALVARRRIVHGVRLALATARRHETLGRQARWVVEGNLLPAAVDRDPAPPCPQGEALHCHEKHRVIAVVDGTGALQTEQGQIALRPGDFLVVAPGTLHRLSHPDGEPMNLVAVEFVTGAVLTAAEQPLVLRVFGGPPVIHCSPAAAAEAQGLLHRIRAEQRRGKAASVVAVRAYIMSLLVLLYRRRRRAAPDRALGALGAPEPLLRDARAYMEANFAAPLRVADLATQVHLSVRQFTARFKQSFGETPIRYLTRLRVAAAQELLCSSALSVSEVARAVGYENVSHFYRTFVQHAGTSPGRYRSRPPEVPGIASGRASTASD